MLLVEGHLKIAADKVDTARPQIAELVKATRAEDGCIDYAMSEDLGDRGLIRFVERWRDQAALDAHMKSPHMKTFGRSLRDWGIAGAPTIRFYNAEQKQG